MNTWQQGARRWLRAPLLVPLVLGLMALLVRLYRLDAQSLWLDEGSSWATSRSGWLLLVRELFNPTSAYPLYHLLLKAWTGAFGDGEWALRLPSALAGALAAPAVYAAGRRLEGAEGESRGSISWYGLAAAAVVLVAPYAVWYGQEAKVYSLLLLCAALITWALARALQTGSRRDWAALAVACVAAVFVHRLAALVVVAAGWAALQGAGDRGQGTGPAQRAEGGRQQARSWIQGAMWWRVWAAAGLALASAGLVAAMAYGLGSDSASTGAYIPAGPGRALWLTLVRFSIDRWPGDAPWWWPAPWLALLCWGLVRAALDLRQRPRAAALLLMLGVPLALFLAQLIFTRVYEARYLIMTFPAWALLIAYPLRGQGTGDRGQGPQQRGGEGERVRGRGGARERGDRAGEIAYGVVFCCALVTGGLALFQPTYGIFSGAPVKEQYREAIGELAARAHPDDAVVIHPGYIRPLYDYYMGRLSADPAPEPISFGDFWRGETTYGQREWDIERRAKLAGFTRSFLLVAPDHARTVDVPLPGDEYGLVGNFWAYSREQRGWPCGIWRYNGAHLLCQEAPEAYYTGEAPQPATASSAVFEDNLRLLGFTLKPTTPAGVGVYRAGGTLPISLFWDVTTQPDEDFSLFLHLCQQCDLPPAASEDGPPLEGYLPTSTWLPGKPARDDRSIALPRDLPPGTYTLLLGLYRPNDPSEGGRLTVTGGEIIGDDRLVLGSVEIVAGDQ